MLSQADRSPGANYLEKRTLPVVSGAPFGPLETHRSRSAWADPGPVLLNDLCAVSWYSLSLKSVPLLPPHALWLRADKKHIPSHPSLGSRSHPPVQAQVSQNKTGLEVVVTAPAGQ